LQTDAPGWTMRPVLPPGFDYHRYLLLIAAAMALNSLGVYLWPRFDLLFDDPLFTVLAMLCGAGAVLIVLRQRPWAFLTSGILITALPATGFALFMRLHILDPLNARSFAGAAFGIFSLLVAVPAAIRGARQARRNEHTSIPRGWRSRLGTYVIGCAALLIGASYASIVASTAADQARAGTNDFTAAEVGAESIHLETVDFDFRPANLSVTAKRLTELTIVNRDAEPHTFTYEKAGTEYNHNVLPGANATVWLFFAEPGTIKFRCLPHSDDYDDADDMVGTIHVAPSETG
jgi:plastocyanin